MRVVTYTCDSCSATFQKAYKPEESIKFEVQCEKCHSSAKRQFHNITTSIEDETISTAKEIMKYSTLPSGKQKKVI
jgi:DNA-directed RNA polymerase subunit RPC12/RpoP